jgi:N-acetylneuraminate synthase
LFLSSPFSIEAAQLLARIGMGVWKIPSGEVSNLALLDEVVGHGGPVLLSSGMSSLAELDAAIDRLSAVHAQYAVLQCTTAYPCPPEKLGLNMMSVFRNRYGCAVGLSDHSGTPYPSYAAATLGADVLEVHVTLSREMFGPDVSSSLTTSELREMVAGVRFIESMIANPVDKDAMGSELEPLRKLFTKSVVARVDLPAGTILQAAHLTTKKPGTGVPAARLPQLLGARLRRTVRADDQVLDADVDGVQ